MAVNNTITHIEIPAPDFEKAIEFYSRVFNWEVHVMDAGKYAFFRIGDTNTGGGLDAGLKVADERQGAQIVVDVESIEDTLKEIALAGGRVTLQKTEIGGGHGFYAGFQDPNGNHLQLHSQD